MKRMALAAGIFFSVTTAFAPALAEDKVVQEADRVVVRKKQVIDFTDVAVEGELSKPEGSYVLNKANARFKSLIKVRDNFQPELQKSATETPRTPSRSRSTAAVDVFRGLIDSALPVSLSHYLAWRCRAASVRPRSPTSCPSSPRRAVRRPLRS